jgi:hypothetical protein
VGAYFFYDTVTGESYLEMLREVVLHELENSPLYDNTEIIWQQDGAPPHYSLRVREFLNNSFPEWIERRGTRHMIFRCLGIMKNKEADGLGTPTNDH